LRKAHPGAKCALVHKNAWELLVATILSAQCTDVRVNLVTPALFRHYPSPRAMAKASLVRVEVLIRSTGFFRSKAKSLLGASRAIVERHAGKVPRDLVSLTALPGVGRKTANVVLGTAFGIVSGIVVDTHVIRLSRRLGLTREWDPVKIERDLMAVVPREDWIGFSHLVIQHGRRTCSARSPDCPDCAIKELCPSAGKTI
jgi:endonuclease-3